MASESRIRYLPLGIVANILKRLPVKSLVRFQLVNKEWRNLVKAQHFIAEHLQHSARENPLLFIHASNFDCMNPSLRLLDPKTETVENLSTTSMDVFNYGWTIVGSCNGVICMELENDYNDLVLWNPAIKEVRRIPRTTNNSRHLCSVGFGFSSLVNDYKIVRFYHPELREERYYDYFICCQHNRAEVFSLTTGSWEGLKFDSFDNTHDLHNGFNLDGSIFWWGFQHDTPMFISFDISTQLFTSREIPAEVFSLRPMPTEDAIFPFISPFGFGVCQNKLVGHCDLHERFAIWVLDASEKSLSCAEEYWVGRPLEGGKFNCFWKTEAVFCNPFQDDRTCIYCMVNLITNERRRIDCPIDFPCGNCHTFNYEESLVSVWNNQVEADRAPKWRAPDVDWIKINVAGACASNEGNVACGGLARNEAGKFVCAFTYKLEKESSLYAEAFAFVLALKGAWQMRWRKIVIESHCSEIVELVRTWWNDDHPLAGLLEEIKTWLWRKWKVKIDCCCLDVNGAAHALAEEALLDGIGLKFYRSPPKFLEDVLISDSTL